LILKPIQLTGCLALMAALASCTQREDILPGERLDPRATVGREDVEELGETVPISLPEPVSNSEWTHRNGSSGHRTQHPALAAEPVLFWSANIGSGNGRRHRITADPVIGDGRVFAMDSQSTVTAVSVAGARLWSVNLTPGFDDSDGASGGGLAYENGVLYVTTGFGTLNALDAETGAIRWTQRLDGAVVAPPAVAGELVYIVSRDGAAWAIRVGDGRIAWSLPGVPARSGVSGGAGPAVSSRAVIFPLGSGDLAASLPRGGAPLWAASLAGQRSGRAYAGVTDITGDPVIDGDRVYVGTSSGRLAAIGLRDGERIWTAKEGAMSAVWPEGGSVFVVTDESRLMRLGAPDGRVIWATDLPYFRNERPKRRAEIYPSFGPILAGGRLRVASADGVLRSFDPETGVLSSRVAIPGGAATNMAVADGVLYVVSDGGQLHAFR